MSTMTNEEAARILADAVLLQPILYRPGQSLEEAIAVFEDVFRRNKYRFPPYKREQMERIVRRAVEIVRNA